MQLRILRIHRHAPVIRQADPYDQTGDATKGGSGCKMWIRQNIKQQGCKNVFTHSPWRTSGWKLMTLSLTLKDRSYMYLNHIDKHLLFFSLKLCVF